MISWIKYHQASHTSKHQNIHHSQSLNNEPYWCFYSFGEHLIIAYNISYIYYSAGHYYFYYHLLWGIYANESNIAYVERFSFQSGEFDMWCLYVCGDVKVKCFGCLNWYLSEAWWEMCQQWSYRRIAFHRSLVYFKHYKTSNFHPNWASARVGNRKLSDFKWDVSACSMACMEMLIEINDDRDNGDCLLTTRFC